MRKNGEMDGDILIAVGICFIVAGIAFKVGLLSWFGNLPGDFHYRGEHFTFYFPFTSTVLISAILSILLLLLGHWRD